MQDKKYVAKGYMLFCYSPSGLLTQTTDLETLISQSLRSYQTEETKQLIREDLTERMKVDVYSLMSGDEFLREVDSGSIMNYDGSLSEIFADGYITNLGLAHKGLQQGEFLVNAEAFKELCKDYKIEVNWANK